MNPITEKYFQNDQKFSIETIYNEKCSVWEKSQADKLAKDIVDKYNTLEALLLRMWKRDQNFFSFFHLSVC